MIKQIQNEDIEALNNATNNKYNKAGCYCIKVNDVIVYIGKSEYMTRRILQHIAEIDNQSNESNKYKILRQAKEKGYRIQFDVLYYTIRKKPESINRDIGKKEGILIRRYKPLLNTQIPKVKDYKKYSYNKTAQKITIDQFIQIVGPPSIQ